MPVYFKNLPAAQKFMKDNEKGKKKCNKNLKIPFEKIIKPLLRLFLPSFKV